MRYILIILFFGLLIKSVVAQELASPGRLTSTIDEDKRTISLTWEEVEGAVGYNLFVKPYGKADFVLWGQAGLLYHNFYDFAVPSELGQIIEFSVVAVNNYPEVIRSPMCEPIAVEVASTQLPMVKLDVPKVIKQSVQLSWHYDIPIADLDAFVLIINGNPKMIHKDVKYLEIPKLPTGIYNINVKAQTTQGISSPASRSRFITVK
jgi:hypothetical protein